MKCTICGAEIQPNQKCCQNCGTRVLEMSGINKKRTNSMPLGYGGVNNTYYEPQFQSYNSGGYGSGKIKKSGAVPAFVVILVIALAAVAVYWFYENYSTKKFNLPGYSIEMPANMKKTSTIGEADLGYTNNHVFFVSKKVTADLSKLKALNLTSSKFYDYLELAGEIGNVKFVEKTSEYICFEGDGNYSVVTLNMDDNNAYLCKMYCDKDEKDKYGTKMKRWIKTIKLN